MMDHDKIKEGVRLLLEGIGEDTEREGLLETPDRIARMCEQIFGGLTEDPSTHLNKQFHATSNNIVLEKDITFYSVCEHHLLPFYGKAHVAYIPGNKVAGLSKLARTVEVYARRPQIQENMTAQIADALEKYLDPKGVMVMIEAEHMCMTMRGVQKPGSKTVTTIVRGVFADDYSLQQTFLQMVKG
jgi:GTP cyclohydrolase I